jgi:hypothetical protein
MKKTREARIPIARSDKKPKFRDIILAKIPLLGGVTCGKYAEAYPFTALCLAMGNETAARGRTKSVFYLFQGPSDVITELESFD